ncbi:MAG: hypothetical protein IKZ34_01330 [Alphaproteobacteria bacterium]|nr:hypothetical protein [Alphaproteobacteria bacterium]
MKVLKFVAGLTISQALEQACNAASHEHQTVLAEINDIMMPVSKNDTPDSLLKKYKQKLQFKYEIEQLKKQRQK